MTAASYRTKDEMISMFKNLCEDHPGVASYEVIGKSCLGNDIYMFKIGNMSGGRVLWDAQLHGGEDAGSEIGYWFAEWLLTSNTERANNILKESCFMVVPVINIDSYRRTNTNHYGGTVKYGVNLNRNFVSGWGQSGTSDKSSEEYRGPSAGSEKETQVMRSVFSRYEPRFYVNTHMWGGPIVFSYRNNDPASVSALKTEMDQLKGEYGGTPYRFTSIGGGGFAIGDAGILGIQSFLLEINDNTTPGLSTVESYYYPKCRLLLLAMFELVYPSPVQEHVPATEDNYDGEWHSADFTISLTASDSGSDVATTYYRINSASVKTFGADGQPRITTEAANNKLEYWSVDEATNEETHHVLIGIKLDKTAPKGSIVIDNGSPNTNSTSAKLNLTATDSTSGVYQARFSNDGVWDTEQWESYYATKSWRLPSGEGTKKVYFQIKDHAGLMSSRYESSVLLDTTLPSIETASQNPGGVVQTNQPVTISAYITDSETGVESGRLLYNANGSGQWTDLPMTLNSETGSYESTIPGQQAGTLVQYEIAAYDSAGNKIVDSNATYQYIVSGVIPEFPAPMGIVALLMIATLLAAMVYRRKRLHEA
jgi:hypothetical protein